MKKNNTTQQAHSAFQGMTELCYSLETAAEKLGVSETVLVRLSQYFKFPAHAYGDEGYLSFKGELTFSEQDLRFFRMVRERLLDGESLEEVKGNQKPRYLSIESLDVLQPELLEESQPVYAIEQNHSWDNTPQNTPVNPSQGQPQQQPSPYFMGTADLHSEKPKGLLKSKATQPRKPLKLGGTSSQSESILTNSFRAFLDDDARNIEFTRSRSIQQELQNQKIKKPQPLLTSKVISSSADSLGKRTASPGQSIPFPSKQEPQIQALHQAAMVSESNIQPSSYSATAYSEPIPYSARATSFIQDDLATSSQPQFLQERTPLEHPPHVQESFQADHSAQSERSAALNHYHQVHSTPFEERQHPTENPLNQYVQAYNQSNFQNPSLSQTKAAQGFVTPPSSSMRRTPGLSQNLNQMVSQLKNQALNPQG
ncbi:MAG: hypothetical protein K2X66_06740 [Cyanobacteria bacterium]|nr:hypothetical protein [Cyanobacteriota bacterium]